jgi:putative ABC transport system ATP-binding protein
VPDNVLAGANVLIGGAFLTIVAYVGSRLALDGTISIGDLIAAVGLTQFLLGPLQRIGWALGLLAQARGSARRVGALLRTPPAVEGGTTPLPSDRPGALRIEGLGLTDDPEPAGLSLVAAPGDHVGLVVPEAAEATRLLDVLARRRATGGADVRVEGVPLDGLAVADARRLLLVSDHDADLFDGTLAENLTPDAAPPSDEVLAASGVDEVLTVLPEGLRAPIGERGSRLSGGQRQRVALARALAADPPVLVLHDPTTAVDAVTEGRIATGIAAVRRGRTTLLVTTSPSLLAACDRVVLVVDGRIVADDDHARLVAEHGTYRDTVLR